MKCFCIFWIFLRLSQKSILPPQYISDFKYITIKIVKCLKKVRTCPFYFWRFSRFFDSTNRFNSKSNSRYRFKQLVVFKKIFSFSARHYFIIIFSVANYLSCKLNWFRISCFIVGLRRSKMLELPLEKVLCWLFFIGASFSLHSSFIFDFFHLTIKLFHITSRPAFFS